MQPASRFSTRDRRPHRSHLYKHVKVGQPPAWRSFTLMLMRFVFGSPPGFLSAMVYGIATICITWFFIEPALGVGVMASKTSKPAIARVQNFATHLSYGLGICLGLLVAGALGR